jgi:hypothetical protein
MNNSLDNKWFNFRIQFQNICNIIHFLACSLPSCLMFIRITSYFVLIMGLVPNVQLDQSFQDFDYIFHGILNMNKVFTPSLIVGIP